MKDKVTVITPTYKRLNLLKEAVQCVKDQTYTNWEHLIIADGHDPAVEEFVKSLNNERIKYFHTEQTNCWGHAQRNFGLKHAEGKFIVYLDDDNLIYKDYLKEMVNGFNSDKIGYVICTIKYDEGNFPPRYFAPKDGILRPRLPFEKVDTLNYMVRKDIIKKVGGWSFEYEADLILIRKISKITKGNFIDKILGVHRRFE